MKILPMLLVALVIVTLLPQFAGTEPGNVTALGIMSQPGTMIGYRCKDWPLLMRTSRENFLLGVFAMYGVVVWVGIPEEMERIKHKGAEELGVQGADSVNRARLLEGVGATEVQSRILLPIVPPVVAHPAINPITVRDADQIVLRECRHLGANTPVMAALYLGK